LTRTVSADTFENPRNIFAAKLDGSGNRIWNTALGGAGKDCGTGLALTGGGHIVLTGFSGAEWGMPVRPFSGSQDALVCQLDDNGEVVWNTFLGGANNRGACSAEKIVASQSNDLYVVGSSACSWGAPLREYKGGDDAFVAKLDADGELLWNTFLGLQDSDSGEDLAVDGNGNVIVVGASNILSGNPFVKIYNQQAFAAKLNGEGALQWITYLGSGEWDWGRGVAVDGNGEIVVTGTSYHGWGSPMRPYSGWSDAFVAKLSNSGGIIWNTFLGSSDFDDGCAIAVDANGSCYVTGSSEATWGDPVDDYSSMSDVFVAKLNGNGVLVWNTFLGGDSSDDGARIAVDGSGGLYLVGDSGSSWGMPVRPFSGDVDAFVAKMSNSGTLVWNTFLGAAAEDRGCDIKVDETGCSYLAGTSATSWETPLRAYSGNFDAFSAKLDSNGVLIWNTFLGGAFDDGGSGICLNVDRNGHGYVCGMSNATWEQPPTIFSGSMAFVADIPLRVDTAAGLSAAPSPACAGEVVTLAATVSGLVGMPTGAVAFYDGAELLGMAALEDGTAALTISGLAVGVHTFTTSYTGDADYAGSASAPVELVVNELPAVAISGPTAVCAGDSVTLDAGAGYASYLWSTGETTQTIEVSPADTAEYTVTVTSAAGCEGTSAPFAVAVSQPPLAPGLSLPAQAGSDATYTVAWDGTSPDGTYELQESASPDFAGSTPLPVAGESASFSHSVPGPTYFYYQVRSYYTCDGDRLESAWSAVRHICVGSAGDEPADMDGDGVVTSADYLLLAQYLAGNLPGLVGRDLTGDGVVNSLDLVYLQHFVMGNFKSSGGRLGKH
jgi:hypothetical protein